MKSTLYQLYFHIKSQKTSERDKKAIILHSPIHKNHKSFPLIKTKDNKSKQVYCNLSNCLKQKNCDQLYLDSH